jgi:hypothetical protein
MRDFQLFILSGGPGLVAGVIIGAVLPRWRIVIPLIVVGAVGAWFGFSHFAAHDGDDNHPLAVLDAIATVFNYVGLAVGLTVGAISRNVTRRRSG